MRGARRQIAGCGVGLNSDLLHHCHMITQVNGSTMNGDGAVMSSDENGNELR